MHDSRFNTHVSALFYDNPTLREQYVCRYSKDELRTDVSTEC